jgi:hypothetical protein
MTTRLTSKVSSSSWNGLPMLPRWRASFSRFVRINFMELSPFWEAAFMGPEDSLPCSQQPSTGPYPEPNQSSPYHPISSKIHFNVFFTYVRLGLSSGLFPSGFLTNILYAFIFSPFVLHALSISSFILIKLGEECKLWSSSLCSFL